MTQNGEAEPTLGPVPVIVIYANVSLPLDAYPTSYPARGAGAL